MLWYVSSHFIFCAQSFLLMILSDRAVVFYFFAILSFTLRPTTDDHTMPLSLTILLQVTIVGTTLFDLICFFCIWITWTKYREGYYAASVTVGAQV